MRIIVVDIYFTKCICHSAASSVIALVLLVTGRWVLPLFQMRLFLRLRSSVQSLSCAWLFATPWAAACQASLSITSSWSLLKLTSIKSVIPSNHLTSVVPFSSCLQSFPASGSFPMSQFLASGGQRIGVSASASVLPMNIQD